jgi:hypothetical protein
MHALQDAVIVYVRTGCILYHSYPQLGTKLHPLSSFLRHCEITTFPVPPQSVEPPKENLGCVLASSPRLDQDNNKQCDGCLRLWQSSNR